MSRFLPALVLVLIWAPPAQGQAFDVEAYRAFLAAHDDLTAADLVGLHPAGRFLAETPRADRPALYRDSVEMAYALTADEGALLDRHGFVVTERVRPSSFGQGFLDVYTSDLPVFLSTDAVLHAVHMSYDQILKETERAVLIPALGRALDALHGEVPALAAAYGGDAMAPPVGDLDVYLAVARSLLAGQRLPTEFDEGGAAVDDLLGLVEAEQAATYPLFAETCRPLDFSQFTVRGHYTDGEDLGRYFQAMMWLGRTEVYLAAPQTDQCKPTEADVRRQAVLAHLLAEAADRSGARADLDRIDALLARFVGAPDNVTLAGLDELARDAGVARASDLLDDTAWAAYGEALAAAPWATQQIRSQILSSAEPTEPDRVRPAPAFLLMGQRFVIDSYVTASVVFDAVEYQGQAVRRMLPSTLDVLFALGNDAAGQLLAPEMERHPYGTNLAAVRYLVDSYDDAFWDGSLQRSGAEVHGGVFEVGVDAAQHGVKRQHHDRQQHLGQGNDHAREGVHELEVGIDEPRRLQGPADEPGLEEQHHPGKGAHERAHPQGEGDNEKQNGYEPAFEAGEQEGQREAQSEAHDRHREAQQHRSAEQAQVIAVQKETLVMGKRHRRRLAKGEAHELGLRQDEEGDEDENGRRQKKGGAEPPGRPHAKP